MFTPITITAKYRTQSGAPAAGAVTFQLSTPLIDSSTNEMRQPIPIHADLDSTGSISVVLTATDDPTTTPDGATYTVREQISGAPPRHYSIEVPFNAAGGTIDLADIAPVMDATIAYGILPSAVPGGELGGTYAVPTVDAVHSGSSHAATQAAAEATAAAAAAVHAGAADPHTGYQRKSLTYLTPDGTSSLPGRGYASEPGLGEWRIGSGNAGFSGSLAIKGPSPHADVRAYGAVGDGVADDTPACDTALDTGKDVFFPPGTYKVDSGILRAAAAGQRVFGAGRTLTTITSASTTGDVLTVAADSVSISDLTITRSGTQTAGANINLESGAYASLERVRITNGYNNISVQDANGWSISRAYIINAVNYELLIRDVASPDRGDNSIGPNVIMDTSVATPTAIRWESGGGLYVSGLKILNHAIGLDMAMADGAATSILMMSTSSFENQSTACVILSRGGTTGTFHTVGISSTHLRASGTGACLAVTTAGISRVNLSGGNVFTGSSSSIGVDLQASSFIRIDGTTFETLATGIKVGSGVSGDVQIGANYYRSVTCPIEWNLATTTKRGTVWHEYVADVSVASDSVYTNYFQIDLGTNRGARLELDFGGIVQGIGRAVRSIVKLMDRVSGNVAITAVSDTAAGAVIDVQFDVTTTSGSVLVGVKRNVAGGTNVDGPLILRVIGYPTKVLPL